MEHKHYKNVHIINKYFYPAYKSALQLKYSVSQCYANGGGKKVQFAADIWHQFSKRRDILLDILYYL
jgi:hypothetical protein